MLYQNQIIFNRSIVIMPACHLSLLINCQSNVEKEKELSETSMSVCRNIFCASNMKCVYWKAYVQLGPRDIFSIL